MAKCKENVVLLNNSSKNTSSSVIWMYYYCTVRDHVQKHNTQDVSNHIPRLLNFNKSKFYIGIFWIRLLVIATHNSRPNGLNWRWVILYHSSIFYDRSHRTMNIMMIEPVNGKFTTNFIWYSISFSSFEVPRLCPVKDFVIGVIISFESALK